MNKRIQELAEQLDFPIGLVDPQWAYEKKLYEFAELIVRECADYIQHFYGDIAASSIGNDIKLHFGIEE